jgi:Acetyltransferase (GNAT) family.
MGNALDKFENIIAEYTSEDDLEFVINAEREEDNAQYVGQWTKEHHINALTQKDIMHLIIKDNVSAKAVGYVILAGLQDPNRNIEFKRIVITEKGKGVGRKTLKLIKRIVFEQLKAHRLWLDVRYKNHRAQNLYQSEALLKRAF